MGGGKSGSKMAGGRTVIERVGMIGREVLWGGVKRSKEKEEGRDRERTGGRKRSQGS